jgi:hypothetical protein
VLRDEQQRAPGGFGDPLARTRAPARTCRCQLCQLPGLGGALRHDLDMRDGTLANLIDSPCMAQIIFRELPAVAAVERQLDMHFRDRLLDDELEELPHLIDDASIELFRITRRDTFYWALPDPVRARYGRPEWEAKFDLLGHYTRDPNAYWSPFGLDLRCGQGGRLHCLEVFGRQLVCALHGLHPQAALTFAGRKTAQAA